MPAVGAWKYDYVGADLGALIEAFNVDLERLVALHGTPSHVVYESPILLPHDKLLPLRKIFSMGGHLEWWCRRRLIVCTEVTPQALKKRLTGMRSASKEEMVAVCRRLGVPLPADDSAKDAADSFAAWLVCLTSYGKQNLPAWDQALYGKRGLLV